MNLDEHVIKTPVFKNNREVLSKRECRISEALGLVGGTIAKPERHVIATLPNGKTACFTKPGKEAKKSNPNVNDMFPHVGKGGDNEVKGYTFEIIWEHLVQISLINRLLFKKILVLLYRNCYFADHEENADGNIRYCPSAEICDCIEKIDDAVQIGFKDKFKHETIGLLEFLHFIDLLGWNEDVKYHVVGSALHWRTNKKTGRPNTIMSVISVPLVVDEFLTDMKNVEQPDQIDVGLMLSTMQLLSKSRGICAMSHKTLKGYLSPYLE